MVKIEFSGLSRYYLSSAKTARIIHIRFNSDKMNDFFQAICDLCRSQQELCLSYEAFGFEAREKIKRESSTT